MIDYLKCQQDVASISLFQEQMKRYTQQRADIERTYAQNLQQLL